jgi:hypothetical protein
MAKGLTFQFLRQLSDLLLIIIICPSGALQEEFPGHGLIKHIHHLVLYVFDFTFKSGDLGGKLVSRDPQVPNCPSKYINFNLSYESDSLFLVYICFQIYKGFGS